MTDPESRAFAAAQPLAVNARNLRASRGWSLAQAAAQIGTSPQLLSMIEKGDRPNPTLETLQGIAAAYDLTIDELTSEDVPTPPELQTVLDSGIYGSIGWQEIRKLKRAKGLLGVDLTAQDYVVLLSILQKR